MRKFSWLFLLLLLWGCSHTDQSTAHPSHGFWEMIFDAIFDDDSDSQQDEIRRVDEWRSQKRAEMMKSSK